MVLTVVRVDWSDPRAVALRDLLDIEMRERYTGRHDDDPHFEEKADVAFSVDPTAIVAVLLALDDAGAPVGHAAVRLLRDRFEVKKVIVASAGRGRGVGRALMSAIDEVVCERGGDSVILQTGDRQDDAVAMYQRVGYHRIPVYEPYLSITNSLCFEKRLGRIGRDADLAPAAP